MTPDFNITADGADITDKIRDRLIELRITDEAGTKSDTVEIRLDDRKNRISLPSQGAELVVRLGYKGAGLSAMGVYTVDEVGLSGPVETLTIRGRAANMLKGLKAPRSRSFDNITIGALVATIADEHGYRPKTASSLSGIALPHIDQTEESDLNLLTRLADKNGAVAKPGGGMLVFAPGGEAKSATGKEMPTVVLTRGDLEKWTVAMTKRDKYASVTARYRDLDAGVDVEVTAGSGEPVYTDRRSYLDRETAARAAEAKLSALSRGASTIELTCGGDPRLAAEAKINVSGVRSGVDGEWSVTRVTHVYSDQGYRCEVSGETPK
jgi:uncharacterized protein